MFSDDRWHSMLRRVRDAHTIDILSDAECDAAADPAAQIVVAADPFADHIVVALPACGMGRPTKRNRETHRLGEQVVLLETKVRRLQKHIQNMRYRAHEVAIVAAAQEDRAHCSIMNIPTHVHNTKLGIDKVLAVGLRRNMSSIGSHNYGLVTGEDLSRQSVCKAEVYAAYQLANRGGWWVADCLGNMTQAGREGIGVFCVSYVCDATNSSIWQQWKLHSLIAEVRFSAGSGVRSVLKQAADVLPVEDGSARGAEAFVRCCLFLSCFVYLCVSNTNP